METTHPMGMRLRFLAAVMVDVDNNLVIGPL